MASKKIKLNITGEVESEKEQYDLRPIEVLSLPDCINKGSVNDTIHLKDSIQLRNFCITHRLPLFILRPRYAENEKEIRYTKFNDIWLFSYTNKYDTFLKDGVIYDEWEK